MSDQDLLGGLSKTKLADDNTGDICVKMKGEVEKQTGENFEIFTPILYRDQVVAGMNYFIKVYVGDEVCVHLRVYEKSFGGYHLELSGVQYRKTFWDPIEYFESN